MCTAHTGTHAAEEEDRQVACLRRPPEGGMGDGAAAAPEKEAESPLSSPRCDGGETVLDVEYSLCSKRGDRSTEY